MQAYLSLDVSSKSYVLLQVSWERAAVRVTLREGDCQHVLLHGAFLLLSQGDAFLSLSLLPSPSSLSLLPIPSAYPFSHLRLSPFHYYTTLLVLL